MIVSQSNYNVQVAFYYTLDLLGTIFSLEFLTLSIEFQNHLTVNRYLHIGKKNWTGIY